MNAQPDQTLQDTPMTAQVVKNAEIGDRLEPAFPASPVLKDAVFEAQRICAERDNILEQAQAESERIINQAREEAEEVRQQAAREAREATRSECAEVLASLALHYEQLNDDFASAVERVALQIAHAIVEVEFTLDPGLIATLVRDLIGSARRYDRLFVKLHPDDADAIKEAVDDLKANAAFAEHFEIQTDPGLQRGRVVLETELGGFVTSIEERYETVRASLEEARRQGGSS